MNGVRTTSHGRFLLAFTAFVILVLVVVNGTGWTLWQFTRELFTSLLDRHLAAITTLVSRQLDGEVLLRLRPEEEGTATYVELRKELAELRERFGLADLYVIDAEDRILASAVTDTPIGQQSPALELDSDYILDAWIGKTSVTPVIVRGQSVLKTGYAPVLTKSGRVVAVLVGETDVRFFETLALARNGLFAASALLLLSLGALTLVFRRLLRRLLVAEEQGQETERLALVGRMSAQICHEIRNPLSVISASSEFVVRRLKKMGIEDRTVGELIDYIMSEIDRLNGILSRFLELARRPEVVKRVETLRALLEPVLALARQDLEKSGVTMEVSLEELDAQVEMDLNSMRQVLLNGLLNARDAMEDRQERRLVVSSRRVGRDRLEIVLEDTGVGLSEEVLKRIFEPFVTSKASGTGLGLYIAKRIVDEHRGDIRLEKRPEGGTRFVVELPALAANPGAGEPRDAGAGGKAGGAPGK